VTAPTTPLRVWYRHGRWHWVCNAGHQRDYGTGYQAPDEAADAARRHLRDDHGSEAQA
jgi:hypothetical protein